MLGCLGLSFVFIVNYNIFVFPLVIPMVWLVNYVIILSQVICWVRVVEPLRIALFFEDLGLIGEVVDVRIVQLVFGLLFINGLRVF
jgi:hypothetical protein